MPDAERAFNRALELLPRLSEPATYLRVSLLDNIGNLYIAQRRYGEAEELHREALRIAESVEDPRGALEIPRLNNLAIDYLRRKQYIEAIPLFETGVGMD